MARNKTNPTLEEIAASAEVSVATVSRVINRSGPVSRDLELRVKEALKALGKEKIRPDVIACIIPEFLNPSNGMILTGIQEEAEKLGMHLLIIPVSEKPGTLRHNLNVLRYESLDGVILHHGQIAPDDVYEQCDNDALPMAILRKDGANPRIYCIDTDREGGMYQATRLLLSLNHTEIAYLSGASESDASRARLRGISRAMAEANMELKPELHRACLPTIDDGFRVTNNLLNLPKAQRPTAILAYNDLVAIGALHAIRSAGLSIPDDMSVIGFDNIYLTSHTNPPLTTVAQPHYQKGQLAVQKLYNHLNGYETDQGGFTLLECSLVVRESTGALKRG